ncbi:MAG: GspE/PulE family protein [bacterium]|nr:GspE/PulE family protein [bacterium]
MAIFEEEKQKKEISRLLREEEEDTVKILSEKYKIPYLNLAITPVNIDALKVVLENEAQNAELAAFQKTGKHLDIAVRNPTKPETQAMLKKLEEDRFTYSLYLVSKTSLKKAWEFYKQIAEAGGAITGQIEVSAASLRAFQGRVSTTKDIETILQEVAHKRITEILEVIIAGALKTDASDIHLEPQAEAVRIRYRLDGVLSDVSEITHPTYKFMLSRVKLISGLKLNITTKGQDGRFTIKAGETEELEVRTSTLPGPYGENIVMRILNPKTIALEFENLGMQPWIREIMEKELKKPNGMILTTGPTGSGKTTTLYAFLKKVHEPGIKIITLEDPIEYHLKGVEQTQIEPKSGYDFASGLRSILRQDPDVILVGEIRDLETAETAMHAALTGHLVFSTLHTNNAAGTIPRLLDIGVKPAIIAPAINVAMAQRLVRRLCETCRKSYPASVEEKKQLAAELATLPPKIKKPDISKLTLYKTGGCQKCNFTGYKGRISVYEIILLDDKIEHIIFESPVESALKRGAFDQGQITMRQDGILKVIAGITSIDEVKRVVGAGAEETSPEA